MAELLDKFDLKTIMLVVALGGGAPVAQYLGFTAPAKAEASQSVDLTAKAQSGYTECLGDVSELQELLADCQERCEE